MLCAYDIETYPNFFLAGFRDLDTGGIRQFEISDRRNDRVALRAFFDGLDGIRGFNSHRFDDHLLYMSLLSDATVEEICQRGNEIIDGSYETWGTPLESPVDNIDLMKLAFGALKELGIRLGHPVLRELPIEPNTILSNDQMDLISEYNRNDLAVTAALHDALSAEIEMRRALAAKTGLTELISAPESGIGAAVMRQRYGAGFRIPFEERDLLDEWQFAGRDCLDPRIAFTDPALVDLHQKVKALDLRFRTTWSESRGGGRPKKKMVRPSVEISLVFGGVQYTLGIGGLHSVDDPARFIANDAVMIVDVDVSSFYPSIIMNLGLCPRRLDSDRFLAIYSELRQERLAAKAAGRDVEALGLKVSINSIYGKTAEPYSPLCDPFVMVSVTLNGQLYLLKLAEMLTQAGAAVLSANTDGLVLAVGRQDDRWREAVTDFGRRYRFDLDQVEYETYARRDVNNYCSRTVSGKVKAKGAYLSVPRDLRHKGGHRIVALAAQRYLLDGTPVEETIRGLTDLTAFLDYFRANHDYRVVDQDNNPLPNVNRWYEAVDGLMLYKIKKDDGTRTKFSGMVAARLVPDLPDEFPTDLNFSFYIEAATRMVNDVLCPDDIPTEHEVMLARTDEVADIPPGDDLFCYTHVPSVQDNRIPTEGTLNLTWPEFADRFKTFHLSDDKTGVPMFVPAWFRSSDDPLADPVLSPDGGPVLDPATGRPYVRRCADNVLAYSALVADVDGEQTISEFRRTLRRLGVRYILYTTHSSYRGGNGERFRVVTPFACLCPTGIFQALAPEFLALLGASDRSQVSVSRAFYVPSCPATHRSLTRLIIEDGNLLDWHDLLGDAEARLTREEEQRKARQAERESVRAKRVAAGLPGDDAYLRETLLIRLKNNYVGYEPVWNKVAVAMCREGFSLSDFMRVTMGGMMRQKTLGDCSTKWRNAERTVATGRMEGLAIGFLWNVAKGLHNRERD